MKQDNTDEILGITRCARCGYRLEGEVECPFCSIFPDPERNERIPKWVYLTACFLTSPFSIYAIVRSKRLSTAEKIISFSGCILWLGVYRFWF